jgi:hypothetical protein
MKYGSISVENLDQFGGLVLNFGDCIANGLWELARYTFILTTLDSVLIYPRIRRDITPYSIYFPFIFRKQNVAGPGKVYTC